MLLIQFCLTLEFSSCLLLICERTFHGFNEEDSSAGKHEKLRVKEILEGKMLFDAILPSGL